MFKLSANSIKNREGVDPRLIEISDLAIKLTLIDFGHPSTGGLRTPEQQAELFKQGASRADGYDKKSRHQSGEALDFFPYKGGGACYRPYECAMVATAFLQAASILGHKLEWGGLWHGYKDMPHLQLAEE